MTIKLTEQSAIRYNTMADVTEEAFNAVLAVQRRISGIEHQMRNANASPISDEGKAFAEELDRQRSRLTAAQTTLEDLVPRAHRSQDVADIAASHRSDRGRGPELVTLKSGGTYADGVLRMRADIEGTGRHAQCHPRGPAADRRVAGSGHRARGRPRCSRCTKASHRGREARDQARRLRRPHRVRTGDAGLAARRGHEDASVRHDRETARARAASRRSGHVDAGAQVAHRPARRADTRQGARGRAGHPRRRGEARSSVAARPATRAPFSECGSRLA